MGLVLSFQNSCPSEPLETEPCWLPVACWRRLSCRSAYRTPRSPWTRPRPLGQSARRSAVGRPRRHARRAARQDGRGARLCHLVSKCNKWSGEVCKQLKEAIADKPVVVLAINNDKTPGNVRPYLEAREFLAPNIVHGYDPADCQAKRPAGPLGLHDHRPEGKDHRQGPGRQLFRRRCQEGLRAPEEAPGADRPGRVRLD